MSTRRSLTVVGAAAVVLLAAAVVLWWPRPTEPLQVTAVAEVSAGTSNCGAGWTNPHAGVQTLQVRNTGTASTEVQLIGVPSGAVFGELDGLGVGLVRPLHVAIGGGDYAVRCGVEDTDPITGPTVHVDGAPGPSGVVPVTANDLAPALAAYNAYVAKGLVALAKDTGKLRDVIRSGDLAAARTAWLPAHLDYLRLGAAYGAFGDADEAINGDSSGFRLLEQGLWHGATAASLTKPANDLVTAVQELRKSFPRSQTDPRDLGLRTHEILEDADRDTLTGVAGHGSGSELAEVGADLDATRELVTVLRPVLTTRFPGLSDVDAAMTRLQTVLASIHKPLAALPRNTREQVNGAVGDLVEKLAPIAVICEPRRVP